MREEYRVFSLLIKFPCFCVVNRLGSLMRRCVLEQGRKSLLSSSVLTSRFHKEEGPDAVPPGGASDPVTAGPLHGVT